MSKKIVFIDNVGRTMIAEDITPFANTTTVLAKNPAVINVVPGANGQLQVQVIPLFFSEFLNSTKRDQGTVWEYAKDSIAISSGLELTDQMLEQYKKIFNPSSIIVPQNSTASEAPVVKLF